MKRATLAIGGLLLFFLGGNGCVTAPEDLGATFAFPEGFRWKVHWTLDWWGVPGMEGHREGDLYVQETRRISRFPNFTEVWVENTEGSRNRWWITDTALLWVEIQGPGVPYPWALAPVPDAGNLRFRLGTREFSSLDQVLRFAHQRMGDGLTPTPSNLAEPQKTLRFPLEVGQQWVVFRDPWLRIRRVVAVDTVTGPDGALFSAWKIRAWDSVADSAYLRIEDWVTDRLWLRKHWWLLIEVYDENGNFLGYLHIREEYRLVAVERP